VPSDAVKDAIHAYEIGAIAIRVPRGSRNLRWAARYNGLCLNLQSSTLVKAVLP
jgi:hypothetical protein